jgi:hypothetical protein
VPAKFRDFFALFEANALSAKERNDFRPKSARWNRFFAEGVAENFADFFFHAAAVALGAAL